MRGSAHAIRVPLDDGRISIERVVDFFFLVFFDSFGSSTFRLAAVWRRLQLQFSILRGYELFFFYRGVSLSYHDD